MIFLFVYLIAIYFLFLTILKFYNNISWQEARQKLHAFILDAFRSPPPPIVHDITLTEWDMQEISKMYTRYFQTCLFKGFFINNAGITFCHFEIHCIANKFSSDLKMLADILVSEFNNYLYTTYHFQMAEIMVVKLIEGELTIAVGTSPQGRKRICDHRQAIAAQRSSPSSSAIIETVKKSKKGHINLGYDLAVLEKSNTKFPIVLDVVACPHLLLTGASGSGKSYALLYYLGQLIMGQMGFWLLDFKNSTDFQFLSHSTHYYAGNDCIDAIESFYDLFQTAKGSNAVRASPLLLICDEFPAMILYLEGIDKKRATSLKNKVAEILMLGRSLGYGVWLTTQRPDANFFSNGARDNFMTCIALGRVSPQAKGMLFPGEEIPDRPFYRKGEGLVLIDGRELCEMKVPPINDVERLKQRLISMLSSA